MEKEQIACELKELKEKMSIYEFVALEREAANEQEVRQSGCVNNPISRPSFLFTTF